MDKKTILFITSIVVIAFIVLALCFFFLDLYYHKPYRNTGNILNFSKYFQVYKNKPYDILIQNYVYKDDARYENKYQNAYNTDSNLKSIILFGDTYLYGNIVQGKFLKENETFAYVLAQLTKRPVYNQATPDVVPQHILFELSSKELYEIVDKKPEYIINLYVPPNIMEVYTKCSKSAHDIFYKLDKGKLIRYEKIPFYKKSYLIANINAFFFDCKNPISKIYYRLGKDLFRELLLESRRLAQLHWGKDVKFIIIRFFEPQNEIEDEMFDELKKDGFIVFEIYKYFDTKDPKWLVSEILPKTRPNDIFWKTAIPVMIKELGIQ